MDFLVNTINDLSTVREPTALSSKNFMLLSKIDTYNGNSDPTYQVYKVSDRVLLRGHKPTIVEAAMMSATINDIYKDFKKLSVEMQNRADMSSATSGYMKIDEVANDFARMLTQENLEDAVDKFVETNELCAVVSELYAKAEELAQEVMDYAGALGMAVVTAHGTGATAPSATE